MHSSHKLGYYLKLFGIANEQLTVIALKAADISSVVRASTLCEERTETPRPASPLIETPSCQANPPLKQN